MPPGAFSASPSLGPSALKVRRYSTNPCDEADGGKGRFLGSDLAGRCVFANDD